MILRFMIAPLRIPTWEGRRRQPSGWVLRFVTTHPCTPPVEGNNFHPWCCRCAAWIAPVKRSCEKIQNRPGPGGRGSGRASWGKDLPGDGSPGGSPSQFFHSSPLGRGRRPGLQGGSFRLGTTRPCAPPVEGNNFHHLW